MAEDRRCTARTRAGVPCKRWAIAGGKVCPTHGGRAPQVKEAALRRLRAEEARADLAKMGVAIETTPIEALQAMLDEAAGNVAILRELVGVLKTAPTERLDDDGKPILSVGTDAIYGQTFHQSGVPTGEAKRNILVVMYDDERDRLARIAKDCAALGLDERRTRVAESMNRRLAEMVLGALADVSAPPELAERFKLALAARIRRTS